MSEASSLDTLRHVTLSVANIEDSIAWYTSSFSCEVVSQTARKAVLKFNNVMLVLVLPSSELSHIAFLKDDAETFGELKERGDGIRSTYVSDPSGNLVKLVKE